MDTAKSNRFGGRRKPPLPLGPTFAREFATFATPHGIEYARACGHVADELRAGRITRDEANRRQSELYRAFYGG